MALGTGMGNGCDERRGVSRVEAELDWTGRGRRRVAWGQARPGSMLGTSLATCTKPTPDPTFAISPARAPRDEPCHRPDRTSAGHSTRPRLPDEAASRLRALSIA